MMPDFIQKQLKNPWLKFGKLSHILRLRRNILANLEKNLSLIDKQSEEKENIKDEIKKEEAAIAGIIEEIKFKKNRVPPECKY